MKTKEIIGFASCLGLLCACEASDQQDEDVFNDLEVYVQSVEDTVDQKATVSWQEIESEYQTVQGRTQQALESSNRNDNQESRERLRELEERFQESKRAYQIGDNDSSRSFDQYENLGDTLPGSGDKQSKSNGDTLERFP